MDEALSSINHKPIQVESSSDNEVQFGYVMQVETQRTDVERKLNELKREIEGKFKELQKLRILHAKKEEVLRHQIVMKILDMRLEKLQ